MYVYAEMTVKFKRRTQQLNEEALWAIDRNKQLLLLLQIDNNFTKRWKETTDQVNRLNPH